MMMEVVGTIMPPLPGKRGLATRGAGRFDAEFIEERREQVRRVEVAKIPASVTFHFHRCNVPEQNGMAPPHCHEIFRTPTLQC